MSNSNDYHRVRCAAPGTRSAATFRLSRAQRALQRCCFGDRLLRCLLRGAVATDARLFPLGPLWSPMLHRGCETRTVPLFRLVGSLRGRVKEKQKMARREDAGKRGHVSYVARSSFPRSAWPAESGCGDAAAHRCPRSSYLAREPPGARCPHAVLEAGADGSLRASGEGLDGILVGRWAPAGGGHRDSDCRICVLE